MLKFLRPGNWSSAQLSIAWTATARRILPEVETAIDAAWTAALARPGVHLFDGPMCRLESWTAADDRLHLTVSKTTYKIFLGTNMANPQFAQRFGTDVMANPLGVSTLLTTADNVLLLGRRTAAVAYHPNRVHPFAGSMEPADADPFVTAHRELAEELSLNTTDIRCIGLMESHDLRQPELIFAANSQLKKIDIESKLDPVEHHDIWSIAATAGAIEKAVIENRNLTPVAVGSLLLWGRLHAGQSWFDKIAPTVTRASGPC
jgi:8-oxo-dGTP pyrophosphatase MutT (NUDIX family)